MSRALKNGSVAGSCCVSSNRARCGRGPWLRTSSGAARRVLFGPQRLHSSGRTRRVERSAAHARQRFYQHNYEAPRHFSISVYHRPIGWSEHRWAYGEILPRAYWAPEYFIGDYWFFGLEVPSIGYECVRDEDDAIW